jgi:hypothetical protein
LVLVQVNFLADMVVSLPVAEASGGFFEEGWEGRLCIEMGASHNQRAKV